MAGMGGLLILFVLFFGCVSTAYSHSGGTSGFATITINGASVRYGVTMAEIPPGAMADSMHGRPTERGAGLPAAGGGSAPEDSHQQ